MVRNTEMKTTDQIKKPSLMTTIDEYYTHQSKKNVEKTTIFDQLNE